MGREFIPTVTKKAVRKRDQNRCRKCYFLEGLDIHHIKAVVDGGTNDLDNLTLLCSACHQEWHLILYGWPDLDFYTWITWPPFGLVLRWFTADTDEVMTFNQAKKMLMDAYHYTRQSYFEFPEDYRPLLPED